MVSEPGFDGPGVDGEPVFEFDRLLADIAHSLLGCPDDLRLVEGLLEQLIAVGAEECIVAVAVLAFVKGGQLIECDLDLGGEVFRPALAADQSLDIDDDFVALLIGSIDDADEECG